MSAPTIDPPAPPVRRSVLPARRRRRLRIALIVLAGLAAVAVVWLVWFSSVLAVKQVRVVSLDGEPVDSVAAEVLDAAAVRVGTPLALVDADAAQAAVASLPWVAAVDVRRGWPNEVVVAVAPRVAVARVVASGVSAEAAEAVDASGVVFSPVAPLAKGLPRVEASGDGLVASVAVLASLPADLTRRVVRVSAQSLDDVELTLRSGDTVRWGSADDPELKATVLNALMKRKADMYDVSAPGLPTTYKRP